MATSTKPRIKLPEVAKTGDIVEIKALIQHIMDEGQATLETLATVSGYTERAVRDALTALREQGTCVRFPVFDPGAPMRAD